jgi:hypothetical protein
VRERARARARASERASERERERERDGRKIAKDEQRGKKGEKKINHQFLSVMLTFLE